MNFTYKNYELLLRELLKGRQSVTYQDMNHYDSARFLMRHDIDYGLEFLGKIPEIESGLGVVATYFLQTSSLFYNIFSPSQMEQIEYLKKLGHRIGLHTDSTANVPANKIDDFIEKEMRLLKEVCGDIDAVSFHQPPPYIIENKIKIKYVNTYDCNDMKDFIYISDSVGNWSKPNPFNFISENSTSSFQVLTHPVLWDFKHHAFKKRAEGAILIKAENMHDYLAEHCEAISCCRKIEMRIIKNKNEDTVN